MEVVRLSTEALVEIFSYLPCSKDDTVKSTSKKVKDAMESAKMAWDSCEQLILKPKTVGKVMTLVSSVLEAFLKPEKMPRVSSVRVESEMLEEGDKKSASCDNPYYRFLHLRVGQHEGQEAMSEGLYLNGLDPKNHQRIRKAWWSSVRAVWDGLDIPKGVKILLLGDRRHGGRRPLRCAWRTHCSTCFLSIEDV